VGFSNHPDLWRIRSLVVSELSSAIPLVVLCFVVFFYRSGLTFPQLQTLTFALVVFAHHWLT